MEKQWTLSFKARFSLIWETGDFVLNCSSYLYRVVTGSGAWLFLHLYNLLKCIG